jgi:hypothetical protein
LSSIVEVVFKEKIYPRASRKNKEAVSSGHIQPPLFSETYLSEVFTLIDLV